MRFSKYFRTLKFQIKTFLYINSFLVQDLKIWKKYIKVLKQ